MNNNVFYFVGPAITFNKLWFMKLYMKYSQFNFFFNKKKYVKLY